MQAQAQGYCDYSEYQPTVPQNEFTSQAEERLKGLEANDANFGLVDDDQDARARLAIVIVAHRDAGQLARSGYCAARAKTLRPGRPHRR